LIQIFLPKALSNKIRSRPILRQDLSVNFFLLTLSSSVNVFFGFIELVNLLDVRFYDFYSIKVIHFVIFSPALDLEIWLVSLIVIVLEVFALRYLRKSLPLWVSWFSLLSVVVCLVSVVDAWWGVLFGVPLGFAVVGLVLFFGSDCNVRRGLGVCYVLFGIVGLAIFIETASLGTWAWNLFDYSFPFSEAGWRFALIDLQLFNVFSAWTSWLFIILLYSWIWIPLTKCVFEKVKSLKPFFSRTAESSGIRVVRFSRRVLVLSLLAIVAIAVFVSSYPYFNLAPSSLVGSDSAVYYKWIEDMRQNGPAIALQQDRPLSNLLMYFIQITFGLSSEAIVKVMPVVCCVALSLAVFWFVRVGLHNDALALISGLFTVFSFQTTVGLYAYHVSNWLALIEAFLLFGFILKSTEKRLWTYTFAAALVGVALLFTHPYTWDIVLAVFSAYLVWTILRLHFGRSTDGRTHVFQLCLVLGLSLVSYVIYSVLPFGRGVSAGAVGFAGSSILSPNLVKIQSGLEKMVQSWVGGLYANPLLVVLAIAGMFSIVVFANKFSRLMFLWIMVPSLVLFVVSSENYMFYRVLYVVPFQVLGAIGIFWILNIFGNAMGSRNAKIVWFLKIVIFVVVLLFFSNYALHSVNGAPLHIHV